MKITYYYSTAGAVRWLNQHNYKISIPTLHKRIKDPDHPKFTPLLTHPKGTIWHVEQLRAIAYNRTPPKNLDPIYTREQAKEILGITDHQYRHATLPNILKLKFHLAGNIRVHTPSQLEEFDPTNNKTNPYQPYTDPIDLRIRPTPENKEALAEDGGWYCLATINPHTNQPYTYKYLRHARWRIRLINSPLSP